MLRDYIVLCDCFYCHMKCTVQGASILPRICRDQYEPQTLGWQRGLCQWIGIDVGQQKKPWLIKKIHTKIQGKP